jgi:hypothetical protein
MICCELPTVMISLAIATPSSSLLQLSCGLGRLAPPPVAALSADMRVLSLPAGGKYRSCLACAGSYVWARACTDVLSQKCILYTNDTRRHADRPIHIIAIVETKLTQADKAQAAYSTVSINSRAALSSACTHTSGHE